jgi:hypothetical protein
MYKIHNYLFFVQISCLLSFVLSYITFYMLSLSIILTPRPYVKFGLYRILFYSGFSPERFNYMCIKLKSLNLKKIRKIYSQNYRRACFVCVIFISCAFLLTENMYRKAAQWRKLYRMNNSEHNDWYILQESLIVAKRRNKKSQRFYFPQVQ